MSDTFVVDAGKKVQDVNVRIDGDIAALQVDDVSTASMTYVGRAPVGSATSSAVWQIQRIDESGTPVTAVIKWAGGGASNQIWDNRTTLTYT
jgi:hypothetical protein